MLGKRPHQLQRTTSMSQLRARPRPPARDFIPPRPRKPADIAVHPKALLQESLRLDVVEPPHAAASMIMHHTDSLPPSSIPLHNMPAADHSKASAGPIPSLSSSTTSWMPSSVSAKHAMSESFMDACYSCKNPLGHGRDIFMYRGDAAFCSEDCRLRQITHDERWQKCSLSASPGSNTVNAVSSSKTAAVAGLTGASN